MAMDSIKKRNEILQKEVDRLQYSLKQSEKTRMKQKALYESNLKSLAAKLLDYEAVLLREQKEVQARIQKKDQQIKVREDLAKDLQNRLDVQYCEHCGYSIHRSKYDIEWEIDIGEEKSTISRKLPPLSLPLPENLPNISFSSHKPFRGKSKLSPVAEESEMVISSYFRNIHADEDPDRFHAVLTASLECLQEEGMKTVTPETDNIQDLESSRSYVNGDDSFLSDGVNKSLIRESDDIDPVVDVYNQKSPEISRSVDIFANCLATSVLKTIHGSTSKVDEATEDDNLIEDILSYSETLAFGILNNLDKDINSFSDTLAFGILNNLDIKSDKPALPDSSTENQYIDCLSLQSPISLMGDQDHFESSINMEKLGDQDMFETPRNMEKLGDQDIFETPISTVKLGGLENHCSVADHPDLIISRSSCVLIDENHSSPILTENEHLNHQISSEGGGHCEEETNLSSISSLVEPLIGNALEFAKDIVRRRSSSSFDIISTNDVIPMENSLETRDPCDNRSFQHQTLIEIISQTVESVVPSINCSKESSSVTEINFADNLLEAENEDASLADVACTNGAEFTEDGMEGYAVVSLDDASKLTRGTSAQSSKAKRNKKKKKKKKKKSVDNGSLVVNAEPKRRTERSSSSSEWNVELFQSGEAVTSSLNNSMADASVPSTSLDPNEDKFSALLDETFNEHDACN